MGGHRGLWIWGFVASATLGIAIPGSSQPPPTTAAARHVRVLDLTGGQVDPFDQPGTRAIVFLFIRTDCPVANRYAPEIQRLHDEFAPKGLGFRLVYLDAGEPVQTIRTHLREYRYSIVALRDPRHVLVGLAGARATPEAAVFAADRRLVYRGRIDDRYVDVNRVRSSPTRHDLREVLTAIVSGTRVEPRTTDAVGCFIADLR